MHFESPEQVQNVQVTCHVVLNKFDCLSVVAVSAALAEATNIGVDKLPNREETGSWDLISLSLILFCRVVNLVGKVTVEKLVVLFE